MNIFEGSGIEQLQRYLDLAAKRQQVIASNLANIDTPGYRTKELEFSSVFREELQGKGRRSGNARPRLHRSPQVTQEHTGALGNDLNNVSLDREMTKLAENNLRFSAVARILSMKIQGLKGAIRGG